MPSFTLQDSPVSLNPLKISSKIVLEGQQKGQLEKS